MPVARSRTPDLGARCFTSNFAAASWVPGAEHVEFFVRLQPDRPEFAHGVSLVVLVLGEVGHTGAGGPAQIAAEHGGEGDGRETIARDR